MSLFKTLSGVFQRGRQKPSSQEAQAQKPKLAPKPTVQPSQVVEEAKVKAQEILLEAKEQALAIRNEADQHARNLQSDFSKRQSKLAQLEAEVTKSISSNKAKQETLTKLENQLLNDQKSLQGQRDQYKVKLQELSQLTKEQARAMIFDNLEKRLQKEIAQTIKDAEDQAQQEAASRSREIIIDALKHGATDYVAEYTVSTVKLPNEESKGRIIGKEGRNIRAFEKIAGVDIDLDETPGEVRLSSFDPIRREVARVALTKLLADGRIQPTRIEEYVKKARADLEKTDFEEGKRLCHTVGVYNLPRQLMILLGQFRYHFSDGQNLLSRTLEQVKIGVALAEEVGANVHTVRLGSLLCDIGKVVSGEEGSHTDIGVKLLKKHGLPHSVIQTVAEHHQENFSSAESVIVSLAQSISMSRPGALYESYNDYIKRLKKLEDIVKENEAVKDAYVLQSGREVRVLVHPEKVDDDEFKKLSLDLKEKLREELTYPGSITLTLVREMRATEVAK